VCVCVCVCACVCVCVCVCVCMQVDKGPDGRVTQKSLTGVRYVPLTDLSKQVCCSVCCSVLQCVFQCVAACVCYVPLNDLSN